VSAAIIELSANLRLAVGLQFRCGTRKTDLAAQLSQPVVGNGRSQRLRTGANGLRGTSSATLLCSLQEFAWDL
jgi:hypothetical protein